MSETRVTPEMVEAAAEAMDAQNVNCDCRDCLRRYAAAVLKAAGPAVDALPALDPRDAALAEIMLIHDRSSVNPLDCRLCQRAWPCATYRTAEGASS